LVVVGHAWPWLATAQLTSLALPKFGWRQGSTNYLH
jgi:hypothetical protein